MKRTSGLRLGTCLRQPRRRQMNANNPCDRVDIVLCVERRILRPPGLQLPPSPPRSPSTSSTAPTTAARSSTSARRSACPPAEIARIRKVSGHVGCFEPTPVAASGALFLTNDQILTAGHIFFEDDGEPRTKCYFRPQTPGSEWLELMPDAANARFGARAAEARLQQRLGGRAPCRADRRRRAVPGRRHRARRRRRADRRHRAARRLRASRSERPGCAGLHGAPRAGLVEQRPRSTAPTATPAAVRRAACISPASAASSSSAA